MVGSSFTALLTLVCCSYLAPAVRTEPNEPPGPAATIHLDPVFRGKALSEWVQGGEDVVPELTKALADADRNVREQAALALGTLERRAAGAVNALVHVLADRKEDDKVRGRAAWALSRIGALPVTEAALPTIVQVISDTQNSSVVRERALWALRMHAQKFRELPAIKATLTSLLSEPKSAQTRMLRYDAAYLLGMVWEKDAPDRALDVLLEFLKDDTIQIYVGTGTQAQSQSKGAGNSAPTADVGMGDGRIMAVDALRRMGPAVVSARADVVQQLRQLEARAGYEPLRERARLVLREIEVK